MARTTKDDNIRKSKKRGNNKRRRTQTIKKYNPDADADAHHADAHHADYTESHRFMSSMTFDGNTLITKTQRDNEPVIEHKYTKEQLAREIPIGKEMVDMYLDGEIPKELHRHHQDKKKDTINRSAIFNNVLLSPADLGLLPPNITESIEKEGRRRTKKMRRRHL
jgi:hypothetical protein